MFIVLDSKSLAYSELPHIFKSINKLSINSAIGRDKGTYIHTSYGLFYEQTDIVDERSSLMF